MPDSKTDKKWMDYAGLAAASVAYSEASRARAEVDKLTSAFQALMKEIDSQQSAREFQKWVAELIYQFSKTVTAISTSPADPLHDYLDIISFLDTIKENNLSTSSIDGIENKGCFEQSLLKAQQLLDNLEKSQELQDYFHQQEQLQAEKEKKQAQEVVEKAREQAANPYFPQPVNRKIVQQFTLKFLYVNELLVAAFVATPYDEKKKSMAGWWARSYVLITNKRVIFWPRNESNTIESFLHEDILSIGTVKSSVLPSLISTIILRLRGVDRQFDLPKKLLSEAVKLIQAQMAANKAIKSFPELEPSPEASKKIGFSNTDEKREDSKEILGQWYENDRLVVVLLLLLPPLGLYGLWKSHYSFAFLRE